jgi:arabinogalactan endo-1,4-beta-galactosidase
MPCSRLLRAQASHPRATSTLPYLRLRNVSKKSFLAPIRTGLVLGISCGATLWGAPAASAQTFAKGADVGWLPQMEATGYVFYDEQGVAQNCLELLKAKGINSIRLRVFVNPSTDKASGHYRPTEVVAMAKRAAAQGFRLMLDSHYSDTWAAPLAGQASRLGKPLLFPALNRCVRPHLPSDECLESS